MPNSGRIPTSARTTLALLFLINLLNFYDRQILAAVTEPVRLEFGLSDTAIGWLGTAFTLFYAAVGLPLGRLSDRGSRAKLLGGGVAVWSACTAASGLAFNYWSLFVARLGVGFGEASCSPASHSLIGDLYPSAKRARALSLFMLGLPIGIFLSGVGSGLIAKAWGWRAAFFVALVPGLLLAFYISRIVEPARGAADAAGHADAAVSLGGSSTSAGSSTLASILAPYLALWRIPTLRWIVLSGALHNFNAYAVNAFMPALLSRYHGLGIADANIVAAITLGLVGVVALLAGGSLADRARHWRPDGRLLLGTAAFTVATPCIYFALALAPGAIVPFMVLMGFGWMCFYFYYATVYASVHDVVPAHLRGTAMAFYFFWMYVLGGAFGTAILGMLSDRFARRAMEAAGRTVMTDAVRATGLHDAFIIVPIICAALALVLFAASRTVERDMRRLERPSVP